MATTSSRRSDRTPWFEGQPLLEFLETVEVDRDAVAHAVQVSRAARAPADPRVSRIRRADPLGRGAAPAMWSPSGRRADVAGHADCHAGRRSGRWRTPGMSVTLTLEDEIDISRGDMMAAGRGRGRRSASGPTWYGWTNGRSIPARVYLLKHTTRTVTAELDQALALNQIGSVEVTTARPMMFDRYVDNRGTGSFILDRPGDELHGGRRHDRRGVRERPAVRRAAKPTAAERLARVARMAATTPRRSKPSARRSRKSSTDAGAVSEMLILRGVGSLDPTDMNWAGPKTRHHVQHPPHLPTPDSTAVPVPPEPRSRRGRLVRVIPHADERVRACIGPCSSIRTVHIGARLLAQFRVKGDVAADQRLQRRADRSARCCVSGPRSPARRRSSSSAVTRQLERGRHQSLVNWHSDAMLALPQRLVDRSANRLRISLR